MMAALSRKARNFLRLLSPKGTSWAAIGMVSTFALALTEYLLAVALVLFLYVLKLVDASGIPDWIVIDVKSFSPLTILIFLIAVGTARILFQITSRHTSHAMLELVRGRMKIVSGYRMLLHKTEHPVSLSRVSMVMNEFIPKASDYVFHSIELVSDLMLALMLFMGMLFLAWKESLLGIACLGVFGLFVHLLNRRIKKVAAHVPRQRELLERTLVRITRNWLLIRAIMIEDREYRNYLDLALEYYRHSKRTFLYRNLAVVLPPFFGVLSLALIVALNLCCFHTPAIEFVGFIYLFISFSRNLMQITEKIGMRSLYRPQYEEAQKILTELTESELAKALSPENRFALFDWIRIPDAPGDTVEIEAVEEPAASSPPAIEVSNVSYTWPGLQRPTLSNLSLTIPPGERFGIIGPNGSGKSTLLALILGILKPSTGTVLVDGIPGGIAARTDISVGYVSDDHFLIPGTIRENLVYGIKHSATEEEIWDAMRLVRLDQIVKDLPGGLASTIEENEEGLSSGEKQRMALARAFLRRPSLLILDEASANLDIEVEAMMADILSEFSGKCTTIIVSHKPGILAGVEQLLNLSEVNHG